MIINRKQKSVIMNKMIFIAPVLVLVLSACEKSADSPHPAVPPRTDETPVSQFAFKQDGTGDIRPAFNLMSNTTEYPTEYGIEFTAAKKGVLYAVGFRMPQTGKYILSLWDVATKTLLLRDSVDYADPSKFLYKDFSIKHQDIDIEKNKKYMASVYVPRTPAGSPRSDYTLFQPGVYDWVPIKQSNITITGNYFTRVNVPTYPDVLILHFDVLIGLVDIGYYATEY